MRSKDSIFGSFGTWQDRVEDDGDVFSRTPIEEIVGDAIEFAQIIVDAAIEPLFDLAGGLAREFRCDRWKDAQPHSSGRYDEAEVGSP